MSNKHECVDLVFESYVHKVLCGIISEHQNILGLPAGVWKGGNSEAICQTLDKSSLCRLNHVFVREMMNDISPQNGLVLFYSFITFDKTDLCFDVICIADLAALSKIVF